MAVGEADSPTLTSQQVRAIGGRYHFAGGLDLQIEYNTEYRKIAVKVMREVNPDIVLTCPPVDYLVDHEITPSWCVKPILSLQSPSSTAACLPSRWSLSKKLCEAWNWVQPNGHLRDMVCRGFMLRLEEAGYIKLPPRKYRPNNPLAHRTKPPKIDIEQVPLGGSLKEIQPIDIRQVRRTPAEKLYNSLIDQYHYLGYCHPVGEHLKYIIYAIERPIGCFAFSSSPRHIGCRDRFIGWSKEVRQRNLHLIVYNTRFLILPWVKVRFLTSHLLSRIVKVVSRD